MGRWTGETITMAVGPKWTYKLRLVETAESGSSSQLVLGRQTFTSEEEARAAGDIHLQEEIKKRSGGSP